jgi:hypothetical protein
MNEKELIVTALIMVLCSIPIYALESQVKISVGVVPSYHSCTRAMDMRCDFYIEYEGDRLINITNTGYCFYLDDFEGCP